MFTTRPTRAAPIFGTFFGPSYLGKSAENLADAVQIIESLNGTGIYSLALYDIVVERREGVDVYIAKSQIRWSADGPLSERETTIVAVSSAEAVEFTTAAFMHGHAPQRLYTLNGAPVPESVWWHAIVNRLSPSPEGDEPTCNCKNHELCEEKLSTLFRSVQESVRTYHEEREQRLAAERLILQRLAEQIIAGQDEMKRTIENELGSIREELGKKENHESCEQLQIPTSVKAGISIAAISSTLSLLKGKRA
jgi:hypothetical protein